MGKKLGFIGLGIMGTAMAENLLKKGYPLIAFNRSAHKTAALSKLGAEVAPSAAECAASCDVLLINLPDGPSIQELLFGPSATAQSLRSGSTVVIFSTIAPREAVQIARALGEKGINCLDAPVSGGDIGAKNASLSIMVGGERQIFDQQLDVFEALGKKISFMGKSGCGQMMKAVNQIAVALSVAAMTESLVLAKNAGLDQQAALEILQSGAAGSWSMSNYAPRILSGDLKPGFFAKHMLKDLQIVLEESRALGLSLPGANLMKELYQSLCEGPGAELGNHALIELYTRHC
ncbi:MAG: NAD(P)-dependent oxidoreductase [Deltaproteobacteria bacterium]|nr:NAD(P)-dependent oxidoreductase [Deltaproteobacteria bacterium]